MSGATRVIWPKSKYATIGAYLTDLARQSGALPVTSPPSSEPKPPPARAGADFKNTNRRT